MIPAFPNFKKLELADRKEVEEYTSKFPPYSDFNFTSLWVWHTNEKRTLSILNENLVVRFTDYISCEPIFSILGINAIEQTAREIIDCANKTKALPVLCFIPEETAREISHSGFVVEEDRDNYDYIYSTSQLSALRGKKYKSKRHEVNKFLTLHPNTVFKSDKSINPILREHIVNLLQKWALNKESNREADNLLTFKSEEKALHRIFQIENLNLLVFTCFSDGNLIGFEIDEILPHNYAVAHFSKVDTSYSGINDFLNMRLSQHLKDRGTEFCNWEQDLGIEKLRKSKMSYGPVTFLKKYKISITNN